MTDESARVEVSRLSGRYAVRELDEKDADAILGLCRENTQYYEYCQAQPTREQVLQDLRVTPPGIGREDKHYVGFYEDTELIAVMDLIDGYPEPDAAFIGFFMVNRARQGRELGSSIIGEAAAYLRSIGKSAIRLAIDKGNPQSTHFWQKNGFVVIREVDRGGWTLLAAEKTL